MAQMLIRNLDDGTVRTLKQRAKRHGRSFSAEVRTILDAAAGRSDEWRAAMEKVQALVEGREFSDSSDLVREDRER